MTRERRLGRGLEALLSRTGNASHAGQPAPSEAQDSATAAELSYGGAPEGQAGLNDASAQAGEAREQRCTDAGQLSSSPPRLEIRLIDSNPFQPRQEFDEVELGELAASLASHGLLQPVVVRRMKDRYQLIAGERRLRAAAKAGWNDVPVQVVEADDRQVAELVIVENVQRKDLNPLEKAGSFQRYLKQYGGTQEELASRLNLDRSTIANLIRLLELPSTVQDAIRQGGITQGHARALLPLGDEREQVAFCGRIQKEGMSVRQTEALIQETIDKADAEPLRLVGRDGNRRRVPRQESEHIAALEQEFRAALGLKVKLTHNARGRGRLVIQFSDHEDFNRLREHICGPIAPAQLG